MKARTTHLHTACAFGNFDEVKKLYLNQSDFLNQLNEVDFNQSLPLDRAAPRGHYSIVKFLVEKHQIHHSPYVIKNSENYSPLLSAIRWYCKVLDGTYADNKIHGRFNIEKNKTHDYIEIIKLLMKHFPEHIHHPDKKNLYGLHYVMMHLKNAVSAKHEKNIGLLLNLIKVLLTNGMSLDHKNISSSPAHSTPRSYAENYGLNDMIKKIEYDIA